MAELSRAEMIAEMTAGQQAPQQAAAPAPVPDPASAPAAAAPATTASGATPSRAQMIAEMTGQPAPAAPAQPGIIKQGVDMGLRALNYAGGVARGAIMSAGNPMPGMSGPTPENGKSVVTPEDIDNIAKGQGPTSSEYMRRLDVPEGPNATLPGIGHVSARGAAGLAVDVATDPLTEIAGALKAVPTLGKYVAGALGLGADAGAEALGKAIYKTGFSNIDAKMIEKGQAPLSELLIEHADSPMGTTAQLAQKVQKMSDQMGTARDQLYQKATDAGAAVDLTQPLDKSESFIEKLANDKRADVRDQAAELSDYLKRNYKDAGSVDLPTLSQWKTDLYNTLPKSFFTPQGKMTSVGKQFNAALASDFKNAIIDTGNKVEPGLGDSINHINEKWGVLLNAEKPVAQQVKSAANASSMSPIDMALAASGHPAIFAAKKAGDMAKATVTRTAVGSTLMSAGQSGVAGSMVRQSLNPQEGVPTLGDSISRGNSGVNSLQQIGK